ncbi:MAG: hypothetical protein EOM90_08170 [Alphaproteobacteria bacterium]|nr:hypothetical protein [Alphaproteobacteria bacterium]
MPEKTNRSIKNYGLIVLLAFLFFPWFLLSCGQGTKSPEVASEQFVVKNFNPIANWKSGTTLSLDYSGAISGGFVVPSPNQTEEGYFRLEFSIRNTGTAPRKFMYKIFYQNESYKFPERDPADSLRQHPQAWENFYGSWEEQDAAFAETEMIPADGDFHQVTSKFRIVGNPRNEPRYFADGHNDRFKRNLRVGAYSFMLVVTIPENVQNKVIPINVQQIGTSSPEGFVNPYFYFLYGPGASLPNTIIQKFPQTLKVVANPDPGAGIFVNPSAYSKEEAEKGKTPCCGQDSSWYRNAAFEQFVHYVDPSTKLNNIPVITDIMNDPYTRMDYNWNRRFYRKEELIATTALVAEIPCQTVVSDPVNHKIIIRNPKSEFGKWQKQNVGVITRHGMTFGKYTVKCKLTELLNKHNMWNGLTNAIWMITQSQADWNLRRTCTNGGYMANYYGGQQDQRVPTVGYSEIDFEILKTVPYCPSWVLPPVYNHGIDDQKNVLNWNVPFPEEVMADDDKIIVSCTNWDMACWQPAHFSEGCYPVHHNSTTYWAHRWDKNYRALTQKTPEPDDELFAAPYYYFQIDWQPDKIIWRIGPEKGRMRVVGYMDESITSIPNNQMLLIITQEFHNTKWWIGSAYSQDNIPFPGADYVGEIFEVTIE